MDNMELEIGVGSPILVGARLGHLRVGLDIDKKAGETGPSY